MKQQIVKLGKVAITVDKNYWAITKDYDRLVMVKRQSTGVIYISRKPVPAGIEITNRDYWLSFNIGGADSTTVVNLVQEFGGDPEVAISQKVITEKIEEIEAAIASIDSNSGGHNILPFDGFDSYPIFEDAISEQPYSLYIGDSPQPVQYAIVSFLSLNGNQRFYLKVGDTYYTTWVISTGTSSDSSTDLRVISSSVWYNESRENKLFYNRSNKAIYAYDYATMMLIPITNIQVVEENAPEADSTSNPNNSTKGLIVVDLEHDKILTWNGQKWKALGGGGSVDIADLPNTLAIENGVLYLKNVKDGISTVISQANLPVPEDGENGQDGKSAYELAKQENPNVGTLQDWLASLKGADGINGINGTNGTNGTNGASAFDIWKDVNNKPNATVNEFLASLKESSFTSVAVQSLPTEDIDTNKVYCVPDSSNNTWTEYIYDSINTQWISLVTHTGDLTSVVDGIEDLGLHVDGGNKVYWDGPAAKNTIVLTADRVNVGDVLTIDINNTSAYSTQLDIYEDNDIADSWRVTTGTTKHETYIVAADFTKMVISNSYRDMPSLSIVKHVDGIADNIAGNTADITSLSQRTATNENEIEDVKLQLNSGNKVYWNGEAIKNTTVLTASQVHVGDTINIDINNTSAYTVNVSFYEGETSVKTVSATTNTQKSDTFTITEDFTEAKLTGNYGIPNLYIYKSYTGIGGRNAANGYAGLDNNGKVNPNVLPSAELGWKTIDLENYKPYVNLAYNGTSFASKDMWREYVIPIGNAKKIRIQNIAAQSTSSYKGTVRLTSDFPSQLEDGATATAVPVIINGISKNSIAVDANTTSDDIDIPLGAKYAIFNLYGNNSTTNTIDLVVSIYTSDTLVPADIRYTDILKYKNAKGFNPTLKPQWDSTSSFVIPVTHRIYRIQPNTNIFYAWFADEAPAVNTSTLSDIPFCSSCKKKNYVMAGDSAYLIPPDDAKYLVLPRRDDIVISYGEPIDNEYIVSLQQGTGYTVRTIPELTNMVYTWWISPLVAKKGNVMAFAWTDNDLGIGVSIYNLSTKEFRRKTLYTKSLADGATSVANDDHDAPCVAFLPDGRLLVAHTCGHNVVKRLHLNISHDTTDLLNFDKQIVTFEGVTCYAQYMLISNRNYIFIRDGGVNWSYIYSDDGDTWTAPKRFMVSDASNWLYYCLFKPIINESNLVRVAMYPNPESADAISDIRLGIIDFSTGNVYSGNSTSSDNIIGNLNGADPIDNTDFETVITHVEGKVYRLFDMAVTDLSTVRIAYAPFTWEPLTFDVEYMVWNNGTPAKICDGGIPFWLPKYQGGVTFINQDEVVVGRNGEHNKDYIERYVLVNGVWKRKEIIYSEYLGNTPIRNIRPILASADTGTYIIWQRGMRFYNTFNDFDMSYCMLDVDKGVLYIQ